VKPGTLYVRKHTKKQRKHVIDGTGMVHEGKPLREVQQGRKSTATDLFQARCDSTLRLSQRTDTPITCFICLAMKVG
jgi:hypothetical protein